MPVAEKFKALGAGNGFPFCLPKINVNTYVKWVTLGGNKKGGPITEGGYGHSQAVKLFWNLYSLSGVCAAERTNFDGENVGNIPSSTITVTADTLQDDGNVFRGWENPEPKFRLSEGSPRYAILKGLDNLNVSISAKISGSDLYASGLRSRVCAMYDGDINDKTKFVGYGLYESIGGSRADSITDAQVLLQSFQQYPITPRYGQYEEHDYAPSLDGFHFICGVWVYNQFEASTDPYEIGSHILNAAGMSASSIVTKSPFGTGSAEASLPSSLSSIFGFYTYPE